MKANPAKPIAPSAPIAATVLLSLFLFGCKPESTSPSPRPTLNDASDTSRDPLSAEQIRSVGMTDSWSKADKLMSRALIATPDDPQLLRVAAEIKHHLNLPGETAELLRQATIVDAFKDPGLADQAVIGLLSAGKLFDAIELLESILDKFPDRDESRRWLFDSLVSTEQADRARPHGRALVRKRKFDATVLFSLSQTEQRDRELDSLAVLAQRNASDLRLQIGQARRLFDQSEFEQCDRLLESILRQDESFGPAWCLLGQSLMESGQLDKIAAWSRRVPESIRDESWQYWAVLGDFASRRGEHEQAARGYWESAKRNPGVGKVLAKLASSIELAGAETTKVDAETLRKLGRRAELLERLIQEKDRVYRSAYRSNQAMADIATTLSELGLDWEAEAWVAQASTVPDRDLETAKQVRAQIVKKLHKELPWQREAPLVINRIDLSHLARPALDADPRRQREEPDEAPGQFITPVLNSGNRSYGLDDRACQPILVGNDIIPIYAQLGSGGGTIDFDLDGWTDVYLGGCDGKPLSETPGSGRLFRNLSGRFEDVIDAAQIDDRGYAQGVACGDLNEDGFDDLVLLTYGMNQVMINNGDGTFQQRQWLNDPAEGWATSGAIADLDLDGLSDFVCLYYCTPVAPIKNRCYEPDGVTIGLCAPTNFEAERDRFFQGQVTGGWRDVTDQWNAAPSNPGRGLGVVVGQLDDAPGLDTYVANDMTSNHYWSGKPEHPFTLQETATVRGLALDARSRPQASMGIAAGDLDADGDLDLFVTNFEQEHNTLYKQVYPGAWRDDTRQSGLFDTSFQQLGFGVQAIDTNNDSNLELIIANGHVHRDSPPPSGYEQLPQLIRRLGKGRFEAVSQSDLSDYFRSPHVGRALWSLDFDRDHRIDLMVTHQTEPPMLIHNQTESENHWIRFRLVGTESSRNPIGSIVSVRHGKRTRKAWLVAGNGFLCSSERTVHVGLGDAGPEDAEVMVTWPDGKTQSFRAELDQEYLVIEGQPSPHACDPGD